MRQLRGTPKPLQMLSECTREATQDALGWPREALGRQSGGIHLHEPAMVEAELGLREEHRRLLGGRQPCEARQRVGVV